MREEKKERTRESESRVISHTAFISVNRLISFPPATTKILYVCFPFIKYVSVVDIETVLTLKGTMRQFILEPNLSDHGLGTQDSRFSTSLP